ncbi:MAG: Gfo/Idh/MocA family oxidoreductase [Clostridiales bacterium]|nr:Gfo/Idh/MocA family oxidoreductase [Clostridiales bacterium]
MPTPVSTLFVGIGGYGDVYPSLCEKFPEAAALCRPVGVVDPYAEKAPHYRWFQQMGLSFYDTIEAFYEKNAAELAVISTPIHLHKPQSLYALSQGSRVLCEKPLVPCMDDAMELLAAEKRSGKKLGVGFQWSFSAAMNRLKADILAGRFGNPLFLKSLICWKRGHDYYRSSGWKGRITDGAGRLIRDSVVTNATAHYLHNMFFLLGGDGGAAWPDRVEAQVLRAKDIQSFDTCLLKGSFPGGTGFWFGATHSNDGEEQTRFLYRFERGTVYFNERPGDPGDHMIAEFADGSREDYGNPQAFSELLHKFLTMLRACREPDITIPCSVETVLPHLSVCEGLFEQARVQSFAPEACFEGGEPQGVYVRGLSQVMLAAYEAEELPSHMTGLPLNLPESWRFIPRKGA